MSNRILTITVTMTIKKQQQTAPLLLSSLPIIPVKLLFDPLLLLPATVTQSSEIGRQAFFSSTLILLAPIAHVSAPVQVKFFFKNEKLFERRGEVRETHTPRERVKELEKSLVLLPPQKNPQRSL